MKRMQQLREKQGDTRASLGWKAKTDPGRVGSIENGRLVPPRDSVTLKRIAKALGWSISRAGELLDEVEDG